MLGSHLCSSKHCSLIETMFMHCLSTTRNSITVTKYIRTFHTLHNTLWNCHYLIEEWYIKGAANMHQLYLHSILSQILRDTELLTCACWLVHPYIGGHTHTKSSTRTTKELHFVWVQAWAQNHFTIRTTINMQASKLLYPHMSDM